MVTPLPIDIKEESGRTFSIEVGRYDAEKQWIMFPLIQGSPKKKMAPQAHKEVSKDGAFSLTNMKWEERENFQAGNYILKIVDCTEQIEKLPSIEISLLILSIEEEKEKKEAKAKAPKK